MRHAPAGSFRILVVDDDALTRMLLRDHLETDGHEVIAVDSAVKAMAVIDCTPVQIVVADWLMPGVSGLELLRWVRGQRLNRQPHFVMLTANTAQERLVEAFDAGVDDFLRKPLNDVELRARMQAWTRLVSLQDQAKHLTDELTAANAKLAAQASSDELTGLANRRFAMQQLESCVHLAARHGHPLACALIDVDHFKLFNDQHGHAVGDRVLKHLADLLTQNARASDVRCRLAGDEFLVILPHTSLQEGTAWANRFCANLESSTLLHRNLELPITVSIGVAQWLASMTVEQLLESADRALYDAKDSGRAVVRLR